MVPAMMVTPWWFSWWVTHQDQVSSFQLMAHLFQQVPVMLMLEISLRYQHSSASNCNRVDLCTNKHINLYYFSLISFIIKSYGTKTISIPYKSFKSLEFISFTIWPGVLSLPQQIGCDPSLANEAHLVSARHPGASFPVHHPQEAVPKWPMALFPLLALVHPFLWPI